jgi:secreted PhoX family phosphatase
MKPQSTSIAFGLSLLASCFSWTISAQTIGTFASVTPTTQTQNLVLPGTHRFQRIIKSGDPLSFGGTLGSNTDFTGYVPISGSSTNGYLSISNETTPAGCAILGISYSSTNHTWTVNSGGNVSFPFADIGETSRFCSGTVTPNNTIIVCEEDVSGIDNNGDGYTDRGNYGHWVAQTGRMQPSQPIT